MSNQDKSFHEFLESYLNRKTTTTPEKTACARPQRDRKRFVVVKSIVYRPERGPRLFF